MSELSKEVINGASSAEIVVPDFRVQEKDIVFRRVGEAFNMKKSEIIGTVRASHFVRGRIAAIYVISRLRKRSSPTLGRIFGRDHSTILYALRRAEQLLQTDQDFAERVGAIEVLVHQDISELKSRPIEPARVRV